MGPFRAFMYGLGLGAAAMYLADPLTGARRRAMIRDQAVHGVRRTEVAWGKASRDLEHRIEGVRSRVASLGSAEDEPSDEKLHARVRSRIGRAVTHPHAVHTQVEGGHVTLSGPILRREYDPLMDEVRDVPGVRSVEDRLDVHEARGREPSLQGVGRRRGQVTGLNRDLWRPATRLAVLAGSAALAGAGVARGGFLGRVAGLAAAAGAARTVTNRSLPDLLGLRGKVRPIFVQKSIFIDADPARVFSVFRGAERLPELTSHVQDVKRRGRGLTHWEVEGPLGLRVSWDARIVREEPGKLIEWRGEPGALVRHHGGIRFEPEDGGTRVDVRIAYRPPAGYLGHSLARLLGKDPKTELDDDLLRLKTAIETGHRPHDAARPPDEERRPEA